MTGAFRDYETTGATSLTILHDAFASSFLDFFLPETMLPPNGRVLLLYYQRHDLLSLDLSSPSSTFGLCSVSHDGDHRALRHTAVVEKQFISTDIRNYSNLRMSKLSTT